MGWLLVSTVYWAASGAEPTAVEFSHKKHSALKLECSWCHAAAASGERMSLPPAAKCLFCHQNLPKTTPELRLLTQTPKDTVPFKVTRHRLPDFVTFSHATHAGAGVTCTGCHESANADDIPKPGAVLKMKTCVDCHKSRGAKAACNTCHELGQ